MQITRYSSINNFESNLKSGEEASGGEGHNQNMLSQNEVNTINGVLSLARQSLKDIMIPWDKVSMLSSEVELDANSLALITKTGKSRLPVYAGTDKCKLVGFMNAKSLPAINPRERVKVGACKLEKVTFVG